MACMITMIMPWYARANKPHVAQTEVFTFVYLDQSGHLLGDDPAQPAAVAGTRTVLAAQLLADQSVVGHVADVG